jgi:hypothetical protein
VDWATLVLNFLAGIAWPVVVLIVALVFKSQLAELLGRVTKLTTPLGSLDAEVKEIANEVIEEKDAAARDAQLGQLGNEIEASPEEAGSEQLSDQGRLHEQDLQDLRARIRALSKGTPFDTPILWGEFDAAARLVEPSPDYAVREAWTVFESQIRDLALERASTSEQRVTAKAERLIVLLAKLGIRSTLINLAKRLESFKYESGALTPQGAAHYLQAASQLLSLIRFEVTNAMLAPVEP